MKRWCIIGGAILALLIAGASVLDWRFFSLTGHFRPKKIVDSLNAPVRVSAINEKGLATFDGRVLLPPLVSELHVYPELGQDILTNGVELASDGSMYALVHVHHWCGNDPVRFHLARVDLSSLLLFVEHERTAKDLQFGIDPAALMMVQIPHDEMKKFYDEYPSPNKTGANGSQPFE
jgi:hypothetical protein